MDAGFVVYVGNNILREVFTGEDDWYVDNQLPGDERQSEMANVEDHLSVWSSLVKWK